jgi:F0F1-type ATP synthase assembly protein I
MRTSLRELTGLTLGLELFLSLVLVGGAGWWVDQKIGTAPAFMLAGCLLGLVAGMRSIFRFAMSSDKGAAVPPPKNAEPPR